MLLCLTKKRQRKDIIIVFNSLAENSRKIELSFSSECTGQQDVLGTGCNKINSHYKSGNESRETVEQPVQRGCGIAGILGDVLNLPGHSPEESELNLPWCKFAWFKLGSF